MATVAINRVVFAFALPLTVAAGAIAATPPPNGPPWTVVNWPASLSKTPTTGISLGKLRIQFETSTLEQVRRTVHLGEIAHQGDAAGSVSWLCYTIFRPGKSERIWITSGEMGGNTVVTGTSAEILPRVAPMTNCPLLPKIFQPISLDVPVWLGSSAAELHQALGSPSHIGAGWREYDFRSKIVGDGKCEGGFDFGSSLSAKLRNGKVVAIDAQQVTSC